jgi:hypothetical protein
MSEDDPFEKVPGSDGKDHGPWYKCKAHGGYFTESDREPHVRAYHSKKQGARP